MIEQGPVWLVSASVVLMTLTELFKRGLLEFGQRTSDWIVRFVPVAIALSTALAVPGLVPAESPGGKLLNATIAAVGSWVGWESLQKRGLINGRASRGNQ